MKKILSLLFSAFLCGSIQAQETTDTTFVPENTIVKLSYKNDYVCFKLKNNKQAKAFLDMLPLTIYMDPYLENTTLVGEVNYNFENDSTEKIMSTVGDLFFYPNLKQIRYTYEVYVGEFSGFPIGKQIGKKNLFSNAYDSIEVTFSKFK